MAVAVSCSEGVRWWGAEENVSFWVNIEAGERDSGYLGGKGWPYVGPCPPCRCMAMASMKDSSTGV